MRICVFGAGAVGGHLAAKLAAAGHEVSVVARGDNLEAIKARGIALREGARTIVGRVRASDRPEDLGAQDVVFVTTKATALAALRALLGAAQLRSPPATGWSRRAGRSRWRTASSPRGRRGGPAARKGLYSPQ